MAEPQFYIQDGVHRAVALHELGVRIIPGSVQELGKADVQVYAKPEQLHSPRQTVSRTPNGRHDLVAMLVWLSTAVGRNRMPDLILEPLGAPGQTFSVPLAQVRIVP